MSMVQCSNGHFYDEDQGICPHCSSENEPAKTVGFHGNATDLKRTNWQSPPVNQSNRLEEKPFPLPNKYGVVTTGPLNNSNQTQLPSSNPIEGTKDIHSNHKTIGMYNTNDGFDPVVGWLVCLEGIDRGKDFSLYSDKNSIGRLQHNDIHISGDPTISRENHATIVFDTRKKQFRILAGEGRGIAYVNILKANDIIEIGETKLLFIPLCGEDFNWD
jgi:hypothetical protein